MITKLGDAVMDSLNMARFAIMKARKVNNRSEEINHPEQHLQGMQVTDKHGNVYTIKDKYPAEMLNKKIQEAREARSLTHPANAVTLPKYITNKPLLSYMEQKNA